MQRETFRKELTMSKLRMYSYAPPPVFLNQGGFPPCNAIAHSWIIAYVPCFDNALSQLAEKYKKINYTVKGYSQKVHLKISLSLLLDLLA